MVEVVKLITRQRYCDFAVRRLHEIADEFQIRDKHDGIREIHCSSKAGSIIRSVIKFGVLDVRFPHMVASIHERLEASTIVKHPKFNAFMRDLEWFTSTQLYLSQWYSGFFWGNWVQILTPKELAKVLRLPKNSQQRKIYDFESAQRVEVSAIACRLFAEILEEAELKSSRGLTGQPNEAAKTNDTILVSEAAAAIGCDTDTVANRLKKSGLKIWKSKTRRSNANEARIVDIIGAMSEPRYADGIEKLQAMLRKIS